MARAARDTTSTTPAGDVTAPRGAEQERVEQKRALQESEQRFLSVLRNVPGVFFHAEHDGERWRVVYMSDRARDLLGIDPGARGDDVLGSLVHPDDRATFADAERRLAAGEPYEVDFRVSVPDGERWMREVAQPERDADGRVVAASGFLFDITERITAEDARKRLEEQLLQAQKMEAVGRVAGAVAHDFNNVLLVIRGYSHVLMSMAGEGGDGWAEAREIEIAAERASDLIRQLLAFSRTQVTRTQLVDLNALVSDARKLLEPMLGEDVELDVALDPRLPRVQADPSQLAQALVNLAANARDAMPSGGTLRIRTQAVDLDATASPLALAAGTYATLAIEDTGNGMNDGTKARMFEPFFSTKGANASGLGLSTVYGVVKQSGGDVSVVSAPGEGTLVTLYLPQAAESVAGTAAPAVDGEARAARETVLLVEDDDKARALVGRLLREAKYDVYEAGAPDEALRVCESHGDRIDLLVSDVVMPQMSGPTLAKRILARRPELPVLFVSGYIERADDVDVVASGAGFLQKPFTPNELLNTVRRVLDGAPASV